MSKKIILTGATGMVGGHLLDICLASEQVTEVISIGRKRTEKQHAKLQEVLVPDLLTYSPNDSKLENVDVAFFCIGVYTGAVARDVFRKITVDMPVSFAKTLYQYAPNAKFCLLSGSGADRSEQSRMIFAQDKGAAENQLAAIGFHAFHTFRPGYIYPVVKREAPNAMYSISRALYPLIRLMGKNASIKSTELAQGMFNVGMDSQNVTEVFENKNILEQL